MDIKISTPPLDIKEVNKKIVNDTVREYEDKKELIQVLEKIRKENDYVIQEFVDLLVMLTEQMALINKDSVISANKSLIVSNIKNHGKYFIDGYIERAYNKTKGVYRRHLVEQNEEFFLNNSFEEISNGKDTLVDKLFMFKGFWSKLKEENKTILKFYLTTMCCYADIRYINWNRYLMIKSMNTNYEKLYEEYDKII